MKASNTELFDAIALPKFDEIHLFFLSDYIYQNEFSLFFCVFSMGSLD
jgi:hypothetical protein